MLALTLPGGPTIRPRAPVGAAELATFVRKNVFFLCNAILMLQRSRGVLDIWQHAPSSGFYLRWTARQASTLTARRSRADQMVPSKSKDERYDRDRLFIRQIRDAEI